MGYRIRQSDLESQFCKTITLDLIVNVVGRDVIERVLSEQQAQEQRVRKLPAFMVVLLCIGMSLLSRMSIGFSLIQMVSGSRLLNDVNSVKLFHGLAESTNPMRTPNSRIA